MKPLAEKKDGFFKVLIRKLLPNIRAKFLTASAHSVLIQQYSPRLHIIVNDLKCVQEAHTFSFGCNIQLICQSSNSSDYNVLELVIFVSVQVLKQNTVQKIF